MLLLARHGFSDFSLEEALIVEFSCITIELPHLLQDFVLSRLEVFYRFCPFFSHFLALLIFLILSELVLLDGSV